jgi:uncharacterized membrane protein YqjE
MDEPAQSSRRVQMLNSMNDPAADVRPEILELAERLRHDVRLWAKAESDLALIELRELRGKVVKIALLAMIAFAAVFCTLVVLAQLGVVFLSPIVGSTAIASLIVIGVLVAIVVLCFLIIRAAASWRPQSIFLVWAGRGSAP